MVYRQLTIRRGVQLKRYIYVDYVSFSAFFEGGGRGVQAIAKTDLDNNRVDCETGESRSKGSNDCRITLN